MELKKNRRGKINRRILIVIAIIVSIFVSAYFSVSIHLLLSNDFNNLLQINIQTIIQTLQNDKRVLSIFIILEIIIIGFLILFAGKRKNIYHSDKIKLTDKISVPKPVGEGQHRNFLVA